MVAVEAAGADEEWPEQSPPTGSARPGKLGPTQVTSPGAPSVTGTGPSAGGTGPVTAAGNVPLAPVAHATTRPGPTGGRRRQLGFLRRFTWGLADQAMSSLSNSAVSLYIARELGAKEFGAFSLAYVTYSFALNASRGISTDPLVVRYSATDLPTWRRAVASSSGTAAVMGIIAGSCVLVAAMFLTGTTRLAFIALGLTLPGLMLQDSWRYAFFALGRGGHAFLNDTIWTALLIPGLVALHKTGHANVFTFVLTWGAAACVAAAIGPLQTRVIPSMSMAASWVSRNRDLGPRYLAENTANSASSQLRAYGVGIILGLAAVGYVQFSSTLMGPFLVVLTGISLVTVPEAARVLRRSPQHLRLYCLVLGFSLAIAAMGWGAALLVALPRGLGNLAGAIWRPTYPLVLPVTIGVAGACLITGASAGLRALGASRRSLPAQIFMSVTYVIASMLGAVYDGAVGAVIGTAAAVWVAAGVWWWQLNTAVRESPAIPDNRRRWTGRHRRPDLSRRPRPERVRRGDEQHDRGTTADDRASGVQRRHLSS